MLSLLTPRGMHLAMPRDYWHVLEPMGKHIERDSLGGYHIDMREKARPYKGPSKDGFPLRNQNNEGLQLLPVTITQMALGHYDCWLEDQDPERKETIRRCADWLVQQHGPCPNKMNGWSYQFDHGRLSIKAPFISAMGQGQGISVLVRAHKIFGDDRYLETAKVALEPFYYPVDQGGVTAYTSDGVAFEEYPSNPFSHILNGFIFALWGVHDYGIYTQDEKTLELAKAGAETLAKMLPRYDVGYWSRYGLFPHPSPNVASPFYHELHIAQLRALYVLYPHEVFQQYADRWERQFGSWPNFVRAVYGKVRFKRWVKSTKKRLAAAGIETDAAADYWSGKATLPTETT
ncbi:D-glucuronyl C5-epimerase family protein [Novipirellula maiorica]|nr:D-glucuronyl C5-epimerase family protein [Rhodopirellula maiorica]